MARAQAHLAGMTIGEWLEQVVRQAVEGRQMSSIPETPAPGVAELAERMQHLEARLAALTTVVDQGAQEIERSLASGFAELERRLGESPPARNLLVEGGQGRPQGLKFQPMPQAARPRRPRVAAVGIVLALAAALGVAGHQYLNSKEDPARLGALAGSAAKPASTRGARSDEVQRLAALAPAAGPNASAAASGLAAPGDHAAASDGGRSEVRSPEAMYQLGRSYAEGRDGEANPEKALFWLTRAADKGSAPAQYDLALRFAAGDGVGPNFRQAANLFRRAAEQGHVDAQYNLGMLYWRGVGVERDVHAAHDWLSRAAAQGDAEAARREADVALLLVPGEVAASALSSRIAVSPDRAEPTPETVSADLPVAPDEQPAMLVSTVGSPDLVGDDEDVAPPAPLTRPDTVAFRSEEARIRRAQQLLQGLGYDVGEPDGRLGPRTREALTRFSGGTGSWDSGKVTPVLLENLSRAGARAASRPARN